MIQNRKEIEIEADRWMDRQITALTFITSRLQEWQDQITRLNIRCQFIWTQNKKDLLERLYEENKNQSKKNSKLFLDIKKTKVMPTCTLTELLTDSTLVKVMDNLGGFFWSQ